MHLYKFHNIIDQGVMLTWNNDNHLIWQHFSKKELFTAECKLCGSLLSAFSITHLEQHLRCTHEI